MPGKRTRVCVIGGAGLIGTHLTRLLAAAGRGVVVVGRSAIRQADIPVGVVYQMGNYGDLEVLRDVLRGVDELVHLTYATVPQTSNTDPVFDILANLPPSVRLLKEATDAGAQSLACVFQWAAPQAEATLTCCERSSPTRREPVVFC